MKRRNNRAATADAPATDAPVPDGGDRWFLGEHEFTVDGQRRLAIPSAWRAATPEGNRFVLLPGRDQSLQLVPAAMFRELLQRLRQVSFADAPAAMALATVGSMAAGCDADKQGRIILTQRLMEHAGLSDRAVLVGAVTTIQIWEPSAWGRRRMDSNRGLDVIQALQERPGNWNEVLTGLIRPNA